jgi:hypothetical protein
MRSTRGVYWPSDWRSWDRCSAIHCPLMVPRSGSSWRPSRLIHAQRPTTSARADPAAIATTADMRHRVPINPYSANRRPCDLSWQGSIQKAVRPQSGFRVLLTRLRGERGSHVGAAARRAHLAASWLLTEAEPMPQAHQRRRVIRRHRHATHGDQPAPAASVRPSIPRRHKSCASFSRGRRGDLPEIRSDAVNGLEPRGHAVRGFQKADAS